jgi:peptidoglycan hydrolase CwlO-like protein
MKQEMRWALEQWYAKKYGQINDLAGLIYHFDDMLDALGLDPDAQEKIDEVTEEKEDAESQVEDLENKVSNLEDELEQLQRLYDNVEAERDELKDRVAELEKALGEKGR